MRTAILVLLGICLLAAIVFGTVRVVEHYEREGRSPYEKLQEELAEEREQRRGTSR